MHYQRILIVCDEMRGLVVDGVPQIPAMAEPPWHYLELETGRWLMDSAPGKLAEVSGVLAGKS